MRSFGARLTVAIAVGVLVALGGAGVLGLCGDTVLGFLPTNRAHAIYLNLTPSLLGVVLVAARQSQLYLRTVGYGSLLASVLTVFPLTQEWWLETFNSNHWSAVVEALLGLFLIRVVSQTATRPLPGLTSLRGKRILVTGATSGVGKAAALGFAQHGANLVLVARDAKRLQALSAEIQAKYNGPSVETHTCDLSSVKQIEVLCGSLEGPLDVLLNNAGAIFASEKNSAEAFEMTYALNHLGYFALTLGVWHLLAQNARVINVTSDSHRAATLDLEDLMWKTRGYSSIGAYTASKYCNLLFTYELARRTWEKGIVAHSFCPGAVASSFARGQGFMAWLYKLFGLLMKSPEEAAANALFLAGSEEAGRSTGLYFQNLKRSRSAPGTYSDRVSKRLWDISLAQSGIEDVLPAPTSIATRPLIVDDEEFALVDEGEGDPILLLHGYPESHRTWRHHIPWLAQDHRVLAPDWLGWGNSQRSMSNDLTYDAEVERLAKFLDALQIKRVSLLVHDYGGLIGLGFCAKYPERVARLAILNSRAHRSFPHILAALTLSVVLLGRLGLGTLLAPLVPIYAVHRAGLKPHQARGCFSNEVLDYNLGWLRETSGRRYFGYFFSQYRVAPTPHVLRVLETLNVPAAVVWGTEDPWCPTTIAEELSRALPQATLTLLEQADHFAPEERPQEVKRALQRWLKEPLSEDQHTAEDAPNI